jgi:hypothetical protein
MAAGWRVIFVTAEDMHSHAGGPRASRCA